jgi:colicin import membrane protein
MRSLHHTGAATAEADDAVQISAAKAAIAATQKKNELTARSMLATRFEMEHKAREGKAREASLALEAKKEAEKREQALAQEAKARAEAVALEDAARKAAEKAAADANVSASKKKQELTARSLLADRFAREEKVRAAERERLATIAAKQGNIDAMRTWPKSAEEEAALAAKYAAMDLEEKCFNVLLDLGMIKLHPDEEGTPEFDGSGPEDYVYE